MNDRELNKLILEKVDGPVEHLWIETHDGNACSRCGLESWEDEVPCRPWYTTNAAEVTRLLEREPLVELQHVNAVYKPGVRWMMTAKYGGGIEYHARGDDFCRVGCELVLKTHEVKIPPA